LKPESTPVQNKAVRESKSAGAQHGPDYFHPKRSSFAARPGPAQGL
jgi:hypothetical protein